MQGPWTNFHSVPCGEIHSLGYIYDMANRRTQMNLPDGTKWLYGYDRLSQVVSGDCIDATTNAPVSGGSFRYAYDGIGNRTSSQDGSTADLRSYSANSLNQYVSIFAPGVIPIRGRADADAKVAVTTTVGGASTTYVPERDGQGFSIDIPVDNSQGAVTAAVQVDALKHDGTLDVDLHRRLSGDYAVPAATPEAPTYDLDGNMLSHDGWTFTWNAQDRLVSATKGTTRLEFNYDYLGRRFEKKVYENNTLTKHQLFVYDGFKQIAEYDALNANALANTYVWQPVGLDVPLLRNGQEFCVSDANKNIVALIGTSGQVTDSYLYDPFGNCVHTGTSTNPFRFSSEYHDDETDLVYYNYRYYSPILGRWLSRDPLGEYFSRQLFIFTNNNCLFFFDSLGLDTLPDFRFTGPDCCDGLRKHIEDLEKELRKRNKDLHEDKELYGNPNAVPRSQRGKGTWEGHRQMHQQVYNRLRKKLKEYQDNCDDNIPPGPLLLLKTLEDTNETSGPEVPDRKKSPNGVQTPTKPPVQQPTPTPNVNVSDVVFPIAIGIVGLGIIVYTGGAAVPVLLAF